MPEAFNTADYLVDRHVREGNGARTALVTPTRTLTYEQLSAEVRRVAAGLRALGVRPEERVLLCMVDDIELFTGILAAFHIGAVAVPASTMLTGPELGKLVADARCRVVLGSAEFAPVVRAALQQAPEVEHAVLTGHDRTGLPGHVEGHTWQQLLDYGAGTDDGPYPTWPDSPALWLYTSGTTGTPKAAMHRHVDIKFVSENYGQRVLGIGPEDRCLSVAKLFFAYGIGNSLFFPLAAGGTALLEPSRPSPALFAKRAAGDRATVLFGTPSFFGPLLASADIPDDAFGTVRIGVSAGEALPARMYEGMLQQFGVEVLDGIGSTEMLHIFISNRSGRVHPGSSGNPFPGTRWSCATSRAGWWRATAHRANSTCAVSPRPPVTGAGPRPPARSSSATGCAPETPTSATPTAPTPAWAAPTTCSRRAASGSRPPRSRNASSPIRTWPRSPWSAYRTRTAWTNRSPAWCPGPGVRSILTPSSPGAGRAWPPSNARAG